MKEVIEMFRIEDIEKFDSYPVHIKKDMGIELTKYFEEKPLEKSSNKFFTYEYKGYKYMLFEELIVEEGNFFIDLNRILDINFFLDREKI